MDDRYFKSALEAGFESSKTGLLERLAAKRANEQAESVETPRIIGMAERLAALAKPAEAMQASIIQSLVNFEASLDDDHEAGGCFLAFTTDVLPIEAVGFCGGSLIVFRGTTNDGAPFEIVQSVAQVSFMLVSVPKSGPVARRMGFIQPDEEV